MAIKIIEISNEKEWQNFRGTGIGASDVPTLLGYNPNKSILEMFYDKVGFKPKPFINMRMLYGKATEELTSLQYECWNGDKRQHAFDVQKRKKYRHVIKLPEHAFVMNDDFPYLFVSPDRGMLDQMRPETTWEEMQQFIEGSLEIKDTSSMYLNNYEDKIAPMHEIQLRTQMCVWDKMKGALAYVIDAGRDYAEYPFERNGIIFNDKKNGTIITEEDLKEKIADFWGSVVLAREVMHKREMAQMNFQMDKVAEYDQLMSEIEPEPDYTLAYEAYMKENYYAITKPKVETQGTEEHIAIATTYLEKKELLDKVKDEYQNQRNIIFNTCKTGQKIILPGKGHIEVAKTKVGVSIKVKV